jgi:hypothetical protein
MHDQPLRAVPLMLRALLLGLVGLASFLAVAAAGTGAAAAAQAPAVIQGTVTASGADSITIQPQHGSPLTLGVDGATQVTLDGAAAKLSAVAAGDLVRATYDRASLAAVTIRAQSEHQTLAQVQGQVTAVAGTSITIETAHGAPVILGADSSTRVVLNGRAATFASLAVGDQALAVYDAATLVATVIQAQSPRHPIAAVAGPVTAVTAATITIAPSHGSPVTLTVSAATQVFLDGALSALAAIAAGDQAQAVYDATTLTAAVIQAQAPRRQTAAIAGEVTAVTAATITIAPSHGSAVTLTVGTATKVFLAGASASLAAIAVGDEAQAVYGAATLVAVVIEAQPPLHALAAVQGQVTAVSAAALTIAPQHGSAVTLAADASTHIFVDGASSTLAAVAVGDTARALYDSATLVASIVEAESPQETLAVVVGEATAVTSTSITITPQHGAAVTLTADASTRILLDGASATLAAIPVGAAAQALYDSTTLVAAVIQAQSPHHQLEAIAGSVTAVASNSITITPRQGAAVTLSITASTQIFLDGRLSPLAAIVTGDAAGALYDSATLDAAVVAAYSVAHPAH